MKVIHRYMFLENHNHHSLPKRLPPPFHSFPSLSPFTDGVFLFHLSPFSPFYAYQSNPIDQLIIFTHVASTQPRPSDPT